ncbi:FixH family protein [Reyranella aquatilis]|jgi:hypothetical protein|uniref:FixH family protein n=1 Tax=Reyranella aquatilis TaxID=2035356 RepID=A0ABS8KY73_9HYPH|nr:FixH family protein [Reyranella aquatilis]MCC8430563.1 FixH family protein [Reyranella aquatilis]
MTSALRLAAFAALAAVPLSLIAPAMADVRDYEFQLVHDQLPHNEATEVSVRLVKKSTGAPVPDAVIFASRIDMAPAGMPTMRASLAAAPSADAGVYRFSTQLEMEGAWQLSLAAKVQGEEGTVVGRLILKVLP